MDLREMVGHPSDRPRARHPWEQSRARFFRRQLAPYLHPGLRVLDIGAGDGYLAASFLPHLRPGGEVVCFDTGYSDEHLARFSGAAPAGLSFTRDRPASRFDGVLLLDVLEHVPDDRAFLASIVGDLLAPGGLLLANVPAYPSLFTRHDVDLGHHRRYRPGELRMLLRDAGLEIMTTAGLFHSLLPVRVAQKSSELLRGVWTRPALDMVPKHADTALSAWRSGRWLTRAVVGMLDVDNWLSAVCARRRITLPALSAWVLAKKP
ncbi:MAG TPA: methyltransferase domain-containing protein [Polyangia bacterium]